MTSCDLEIILSSTNAISMTPRELFWIILGNVMIRSRWYSRNVNDVRSNMETSMTPCDVNSNNRENDREFQ